MRRTAVRADVCRLGCGIAVQQNKLGRTQRDLQILLCGVQRDGFAETPPAVKLESSA